MCIRDRLWGTGDWDRIVVTVTGGTGADDPGDYTLDVTATQVSYELNGERTTGTMPDGAWETLATGVRALGDRRGAACPDGQEILIQAKAGSEVKQTFQASSCDAGDAFRQARTLIEALTKYVQ